ncbi:polyketide synthase, partial [Aquimarina muelleri]|uniref:polyketide synthase n=3 Tax=Aquimarina muelleri TaxID=279356 RepID=UPI002248D615
EGQQEVPVLKLQIGLSSTKANTLGETHVPVGVSYVRLLDHGNGMYSIRIDCRTNENTLSKEVINQLVEALEFVQQISSLKVLLLKGVDSVFLQGDREAYNEAVLQNLYVAVASFPYPLVSVMQGDATGAGFLIGALSDFMICSKESTYGYSDLNAGMFASVEEEALFKERFGEALTLDLLYQSRVLQGKELQQKGWSFPVLPSEQVEEYAEQLAVSLSKKSQTALRLLKQHLGRHILKYTKKLKTVEAVREESNSKVSTVKITSSSKYLKLENTDPHILTIQIGTGKKPYTLTDLISGFTNIFSQVAKSEYYKAIVLTSDGSEFISVSDRETSEEDILKLQDLIYGSTVPVIAAIRSNAKDISLWIAQSCDGCIYQTEGKYSASKLLERPELAKRAAMVFADRLSPYVCKELLLRGKTYTGAELQQQLGAVTVVDKAEVLAKAKELAQQWTKLPLASVTSWKQKHALLIREKIEQLPVWLETKAPEVSFPKVPTAIPLHTKVIQATLYPEGILEVKMEDRDAKNMFSTAFLEGIIEVFQHIAATATYKVVVLTGYDTYFASGGTKESLLAIQQGKAKFTDTKVFQLAMECTIPVIAAMQGHGIGAGWSLGMFSDFILFSEQSHYVSPYMNYGFTPGAAATLAFPDKTGYDLARETLLTAVEYSGRELQEKGLYYPVLPREELLSKAFDLAKEIAKHSRDSLIAIKEQLTKHLRDQLEDTYRLELEMHEKTFVGKIETLQQIERNFYNATTDTQTKTIPEKNIQDYKTQGVVESRDIFLPDIISNLKKLLAQELHLEEEEIDPDSQFVDLGLDSIVGVTFIRKISDAYTIPLQATIVYSYSTLAKLSAHVKEEAEKLGVLVSEPAYQDPIDTRSTISKISQSRDIFLPDIISNLKKLLAQELHLEEEEIDQDSQFVDLGLDSIVGVTFIRKISDAYSIPLQATIVYSYSTLAKLSAHVQEEAEKLGTLVGEGSTFEDRQQKIIDRGVSRKEIEKKKKLISWRDGSKLVRTASKSKRGTSSQAIAVIGMAGQFPEAKDVEEFWQNIAGGKNCIREVSKERWDIDTYYSEGEVVSGKTYSKWMGALEEYDLFDPMFFTISPVEAESMDPQQRLFLQSCWHTIENAGYSSSALSGSKCGVYVGCAYGDYQMLSREQQLSAQGFTGSSTSILAARISYFLNLQGPCISIDTACSSSLVAIANACDSLVSGSIDSALAGGVYVMSGPDMHIKTAQSGMLSADGRCYTFDQRANGFVPGEGVGVVMLKRLEDAEKDQDTILGVIQGWGVNQDGKTNGITAPNTESQTLLEQQVYDQFDIDPNNIQLIETHGTGTKLGDPIEVEGLRKSFKKYTEEKAYCALGSVKSNIGHCLTAAGVAGFIKVLQAIKHQQLPPTINFEKLNEHIGLEGSPFYVNTELKDWEVDENQSRQAAISSFGFSGTNAHLVLGEYTAQRTIKTPVQGITQNSELMIPLSAKSEEQLRVKASDLLRFIEKEGDSLDLVEIAYTLQVGREAMEERLGFMVSSVFQLAEKLKMYIKQENTINGIYQGHVKRNKEGLRIISNDNEMREVIIQNWISQKKLSKLLDLWVKGLELDWNKFYGNQKPKRISLPLYPFAKERYWIEATPNKQDKEIEQTASILHPLLHVNTSDFSKQSYSSTFNGEEFFLKDHQVFNKKILPGVAYLEMVQVAIKKAMPAPVEQAILELNNTAWIQPFVVDHKKQINTTLLLDDSDLTADKQIHYKVSSYNEEKEIIHFQGQAMFGSQQVPEKLDILGLRDQMIRGKLEKNDIYTVFNQMKLYYGPAHQGVVAIYKGEQQVLADLILPTIVETEERSYLLHPSLMDSALQASIGLFQDLNQISPQPLLPFALESVRIISACTKNMVAWIRYSPESNPDSRVTKLDIDLCDQEGHICVQIKGIAFRVMENNNSPINTNGTSTFNETYYQKLIQSVLNKELSDEEAVELV